MGEEYTRARYDWTSRAVRPTGVVCNVRVCKPAILTATQGCSRTALFERSLRMNRGGTACLATGRHQPDRRNFNRADTPPKIRHSDVPSDASTTIPSYKEALGLEIRVLFFLSGKAGKWEQRPAGRWIHVHVCDLKRRQRGSAKNRKHKTPAEPQEHKLLNRAREPALRSTSDVSIRARAKRCETAKKNKSRRTAHAGLCRAG